MLRDASIPTSTPPEGWGRKELQGVRYRSARWSPATIGRLMDGLERNAADLRNLPTRRLQSAWEQTLAELSDRASSSRRRLDGPLARLSRLSAAGLEAALETVLGGQMGESAADIWRQAEDGDPRPRRPAVVFLSSNLPALASQPLLPALAQRRPVLLKSPSSEPLFTPLLVDRLCHFEPRLRPALAALTWSGGDTDLETPVLQGAGKVLAYGGQEAMQDLARRAGRRLLPFGPKLSLAVVDRQAAIEATAAGLARDIALFDQRGCLSVQAIYTDAEPLPLAEALAHALAERAAAWPPGPLDPSAAAAVQQLRGEAAMRGLHVSPLPLSSGTVIIEPEPELVPSPGLRSVRIHPLAGLADLPEILRGWRGRLQGVARPEGARELDGPLTALGVSRFALPGSLQAADSHWHNGGVSPLEALA